MKSALNFTVLAQKLLSKKLIINNYFYYYDIALRGLINSPWNVCPLSFGQGLHRQYPCLWKPHYLVVFFCLFGFFLHQYHRFYLVNILLHFYFRVQVPLKCQVSVITVFTVFRLLTDFVCLYNYEFWLSLCKIVRSSLILSLPLFIPVKFCFEYPGKYSKL